jgi:amino acid adenylation domain-containing protein
MNKDEYSETHLSGFINAVKACPERNAFVINEVPYTYQYLWGKISIIRAAVNRINVDNRILGLVVHDDIETYASIFALWLEGLGYVPLHPKHPLRRNLEIIHQSGIMRVLDSAISSDYSDAIALKTSGLNENIFREDINEIPKDTIAYILFTSGSTGQPKGVQITHGNLTAFINDFFKSGIRITQEDKCLQCFDLTFDVSVQSFLAPLIKGATVYTVPHDQIKYSYVYGLLEDHNLTFGVFAPSMLRYLRPYFDELNFPSLKYCILTAEASPVDLVMEWWKCIPNASIYNFYGPTEATIYCTYYQVPKTGIKQANGLLCIGRPFENIHAVILDDNLTIVDANSKGEMYISGPQLAPGYWENPERTSEAFKELTIEGVTNRYYKTGDLCLIDEQGDILYFGRLDYQVKVQGYRIELGEIEFKAREIVSGKNAVAFAYCSDSGVAEIAVCLETDEVDQNDFIDKLKASLPSYMMPSKIWNMHEFPINSSGKIDRNSIKSLLGHS